MTYLGDFARILAVLAVTAGLVLLPPDIAESAQKRTSHKTVRKAPVKKKPAAAKRESPAAKDMDQDWQKTAALVQKQQDPVARKLLTWIYVTGTKMPIEPKQLIAFRNANPNWPRMGDFREKIEQNIAASLPASDVAAWFAQNPPLTFNGIRAHVDALVQLNQPAQAQTALSAFWKDAELSKNQTAALAGAYKFYFAAGDHVARLDNLIWENRYEEAQYMLAFVDADTRAVAQARIALGKMSKTAPQLAEAVPAARQNDEGLLYERLRWRRRHNMDDGALDIIRQMPATVSQPELWWGEMNVMARRAMEKHNYLQAFQIAEKHALKSGIQYSQAEWLLGWLELRHLKQPTGAYSRFQSLYKHVGTAISKSRAAYWAARAADAVPDHTLGEQWDKLAASFPSTFYGQLSYQKLYGAPAQGAFNDPAPDPEAVAAFNRHELVRAVRLLHSVKLDQLIDPFLAKLDSLAQSKLDYILTGRLALETGRYYYTVESNKELQQKLGLFMFEEGYPTLPPLPAQTPEKALVHAIIHRESMFNPLALSQAGARGLMQLMPATAKAIAKREGETYNIKRLTADPRYNVQIGSAYLRQLIDAYGGFYPMAIAAYNAGPGNVAEWIAEFGDPRTGNIDLIDWIESVPIYETRNYIQRVMESYYIYRLRFGEEPKTVLDFVKK
jgi:soluble lytic murein transglycosylase